MVRRCIYVEAARRVSLIQSRVPQYASDSQKGSIDLGGKGNLAKAYGPAVSYFKRYDCKNLPDDKILEDDLNTALHLYDLLLDRGGCCNLENGAVSNGHRYNLNMTIEEMKQYRKHRRVERNPKVSKEVKKRKGYTCEACRFNFEKAYGPLGKGYIEAHHLIPLATLKEGVSTQMDIDKDFAVLCANCHRVVHKGKFALTMGELKSALKR